jgi:hypothetical protein
MKLEPGYCISKTGRNLLNILKMHLWKTLSQETQQQYDRLPLLIAVLPSSYYMILVDPKLDTEMATTRLKYQIK